MKRSVWLTVAVVGVAGAVALPSVVGGNSRRNDGSLAGLALAETPYLADLKGSNEVPTAGDPDGKGAATVSFDFYSTTVAEVCWDLAYSGIAAPTGAHIHRGAAGVNGPIVVDFGAPGATSHKGCLEITATLADEILANPAGFYVNVHNTEFTSGAIRGQLAGGPAPAGSVHFLPVPLRAYDSRVAPATKFGATETRTISLANGKDLANNSFIAVPPGATGAIVTVTAVQTNGAGFVKFYSAAVSEPATSSLNFGAANAAVTVNAQVAVDSAGAIKVTSGPVGFHVIIDVVAYLY
jgi:hypothetical protein